MGLTPMSMQNEFSAPKAPCPSETARYTKEMLESLKKIAVQQNQQLLAHLLDLAALEAKSLGETQRQDTLFPG
jgi:hypothetical protein